VLACFSALALTALLGSPVAPAGAAEPADQSAATAAVAWLKAQQQSDGGFEQTAFAGFETTDVVVAIAEQAQTGPAWNAAEARDAVESLHFGGTPSGKTPIDYLVDLTANAADQGVPAKNLVLVALALGFDPTDFGGVDLVDRMGGCEGDETLGFNGLLWLAIAQALACGGAPPANVTAIRNAQQDNGGWNFAGDPSLTDIDTDSTVTAIEALVANGATVADLAIRKALAFLAVNQQANGAWQFFGEDDTNSTAMAVLGIAAAGYDPATPCWRDTFASQLAGTPYARPDAWLRSLQVTSGPGAGRFTSPADQFGITTFVTSQTVEALLRSWYPVVQATPQPCTAADAPPGPGPANPGVEVAGETVNLQPRLAG
jgi:hypothetical protein